MKAFIDANIFLSFYRYSNDDLEQLRKLEALVGEEIELLLPQQTKDEVNRNREKVISDSLKQLKSDFPKSFPSYSTQYESYRKLRRSIEIAQTRFDRLKAEIDNDINDRNLLADNLLRGIFAKSTEIAISGELLAKAKIRFDRGNPPGKNGSYGDAIVWECLLNTVDEGENLIFIADDKDFKGILNKDQFNPFLEKEWGHLKESEIEFHSKLSSFFRTHFPDIRLASEIEKERAISRLERAATFTESRSATGSLFRRTDLSKSDVERIVRASVENDQVYRADHYVLGTNTSKYC